MNYDQAIEYLYNLNSLGWKLGLGKIKSLLKELGNPQEKYKLVHIAGTNGKGSTSAMIESILATAGYNTALYTSPHLTYVGERIKCNGIPISKDDLVKYIESLKPLIAKYKCTFFEAMTAIAFLYFADKKVEIAVIEVGLGGRLDATNVINPLVTIITNIEIDHTKQLGPTRKSIAVEKAGIIKQGTICITNCRYKGVEAIFEKTCQEQNAEHIQVDRLLKISNLQYGEKFTTLDMAINGSVFPQLKIGLIGEHQIHNAALAVTAADIINSRFMPIKIEDIYHGLLDVQWPGRLQTISYNPRVVIDVAHNAHGIAYLKKSIRSIYNYDRLIVVFGVCKDKNFMFMINKLASISDLFIAVKANTHRGLATSTISRIARKFTPNVKKSASVAEGFAYAMESAQKTDLILCAGSHYTVSEVMESFYQKSAPTAVKCF
ncbi:MAG: bifunctional folylpolyglutamate synthase/dihydrofolate synthase [Candidatus Zhuqueibacterota bacterium]